MDVMDLYGSKYVKAADLQGQDVTATIARVDVEVIGQEGDSDRKAVAYFDGFTKGLVLNKVNALTISSMYGTETNGWIGRAVTIYPTTTMFGSEMKPCIRIRDAGPQQPVPVPAPVPQPQPVQMPVAQNPTPQQPTTGPQF